VVDEPTTRPNLTPDHGRQRETDLPLRVRAEIDRREETAERLIGWVQLGIVLFFALLYAIAPRAEGASGLNFVPLVLSAYLAFTLFRLVLSYRMRLPQWYLILSIVVDVLLLCGLIFSFHIQYMQHPAFYLKAPTLLYLFLFISLRALRFDPLFVLLSGLIGVFGWLAMLAYAMLSDMGGMHVTRNYVEYLTSNSILIGAEIDKILTIVGVTAILALALHRGRQVLFDAIQGQSAANDLRQFFAPEVAHSITRAEDMPATGRGEACHAAILFVDIRSFTTIAEAMELERSWRS
jgi:adenylate cyclase